ncbi:hypothetical protein [Rickettsia endosymbiont of Ceutorhynchus obstrictus]
MREYLKRHCERPKALSHGSKIAIFWVFFKSTSMSCRGLTTASSQAF